MIKVEPIMGLYTITKRYYLKSDTWILHQIIQPYCMLAQDVIAITKVMKRIWRYYHIVLCPSCPYNNEGHECEYDVIIDPSPCALSLVPCSLFPILVGFWFLLVLVSPYYMALFSFIAELVFHTSSSLNRGMSYGSKGLNTLLTL